MYRCNCCGLLTEARWKMNKVKIKRGGCEAQSWHLCGQCLETMMGYMSEKAEERKRAKIC